jgi:diaminopimelate decarboxylase
MNSATETSATGPWTRLDAGFWESLAAQHGSPFYLFDADRVRQRVQSVRDAVGGLAGVYYAVKANPNLGLLRAVRGAVDGVDISSGGELAQCLLAGHAPEAMSFAGPGKTDDELEHAIRQGVRAISVESEREIQACADIARRLGRVAAILLRVNPATVHRAYGLKMGGRAVQFGIDEDALPQAVARVMANREHLDCEGLHCYVGSQCFDGDALLDSVGHSLRLAQAFETLSGLPCRKLNLGGGFGVAQSGDARELALAGVSGALRERIGAHLADRPGAQVFFELGRYILAEAGIYVTRVIDAKVSRGTRFLVCDGGLNHQLAAAGTFGAALRGNFPAFNLSRPGLTPEVVNIAGPSCNPTDLLGVQVSLPLAQVGDLLGIGMSGSYGLTASPMLFLGHDTPAEWVLDGGTPTLGRRRFNVLDFN